MKVSVRLADLLVVAHAEHINLMYTLYFDLYCCCTSELQIMLQLNFSSIFGNLLQIYLDGCRIPVITDILCMARRTSGYYQVHFLFAPFDPSNTYNVGSN